MLIKFQLFLCEQVILFHASVEILASITYRQYWLVLFGVYINTFQASAQIVLSNQLCVCHRDK